MWHEYLAIVGGCTLMFVAALAIRWTALAIVDIFTLTNQLKKSGFTGSEFMERFEKCHSNCCRFSWEIERLTERVAKLEGELEEAEEEECD